MNHEFTELLGSLIGAVIALLLMLALTVGIG